MDAPDDRRQLNVIEHEVKLCTNTSAPRGDNRHRRASRKYSQGHVDDLWPFSRITAGVKVINNAGAGELSDTIEFDTPEAGKL